jgi:hypothetical protein
LAVRRRGWRPVGPQATGRSLARTYHPPSPCRPRVRARQKVARKVSMSTTSVLPSSRTIPSGCPRSSHRGRRASRCARRSDTPLRFLTVRNFWRLPTPE